MTQCAGTGDAWRLRLEETRFCYLLLSDYRFIALARRALQFETMHT